MNNGKHGQGTHSTKMGADSLAENTPNASKHFSPKCLPKPKSWNFLKKALSLWVTIVRGFKQPTEESSHSSAQLEREKKQKNFLNSVGKLISNSIRETTGKSGMIEKDTILLVSSF